jgi:hypothetical protein
MRVQLQALRLALRKHRLDAAQGLAGALFILDERETHMRVAVVAEADAGRDGGLRFVQQELGKFERAELAVVLSALNLKGRQDVAAE